jgi:hypothetical protein
MMMMPTWSLQEFVIAIAQADSYPFYGVLLYTPMNGLDGRMHQYVTDHWSYLNRLTGHSCLVFAIENIDQDLSITDFKPEEVYDIARHLGASVGDLPCMVFFVDPQKRSDTLVLRLRDLFPPAETLTDDAITLFFRTFQSIIDTCSQSEPSVRLTCLRDGVEGQLTRNGPAPDARNQLSGTTTLLAPSQSPEPTLLKAIQVISQMIDVVQSGKKPVSSESDDEVQEDAAGIKSLIKRHKQRLQILKEQQATYGLSVDPKIPIEIKEIEQQIAQLRVSLGHLKHE